MFVSNIGLCLGTTTVSASFHWLRRQHPWYDLFRISLMGSARRSALQGQIVFLGSEKDIKWIGKFFICSFHQPIKAIEWLDGVINYTKSTEFFHLSRPQRRAAVFQRSDFAMIEPRAEQLILTAIILVFRDVWICQGCCSWELVIVCLLMGVFKVEFIKGGSKRHTYVNIYWKYTIKMNLFHFFLGPLLFLLYINDLPN